MLSWTAVGLRFGKTRSFSLRLSSVGCMEVEELAWTSRGFSIHPQCVNHLLQLNTSSRQIIIRNVETKNHAMTGTTFYHEQLFFSSMQVLMAAIDSCSFPQGWEWITLCSEWSAVLIVLTAGDTLKMKSWLELWSHEAVQARWSAWYQFMMLI